MLNYKECEDLIFESYNRIAPTLKGYDSQTRNFDAIRWLFAQAHLPFSFAPTVTVTGSKGKGSTSILCAAILQGAGRRVGLLTSPSFISHRERIRVNGEAISEDDFVRIVNQLAPLIRSVENDLGADKYLSPTGLFLAIAVRYFMEQGVDAAVLEVGRGGRFDEVSLIENHVACITPIMEEHLDKLGPDIESVAWNKAGIIKASNIVVSGRQSERVNQVLEAECEARNAAVLYRVPDSIRHMSGYQWDWQSVQVELEFAAASNVSKTLKLYTPATYQGQNVALAYAAAVALDPQCADVDTETTARARLPGRCQLVASNPRVIVDGAINRQSAHALLGSILHLIDYPAMLVTALPRDKDYAGVLDELMPYVDRTIVTQVSARHLQFSNNVYDYALTKSNMVMDVPDVRAAFSAGLDYVGDDGTLLVVGTQSLVKDAMEFWHVPMDWLII